MLSLPCVTLKLPPWAMAAALKLCGPGDRHFNVGLFICTKMTEWVIPLVEIRAGGRPGLRCIRHSTAM